MRHPVGLSKGFQFVHCNNSLIHPPPSCWAVSSAATYQQGESGHDWRAYRSFFDKNPTSTQPQVIITVIGFEMIMTFHHHPPHQPLLTTHKELLPGSVEITKQKKPIISNKHLRLSQTILDYLKQLSQTISDIYLGPSKTILDNHCRLSLTLFDYHKQLFYSIFDNYLRHLSQTIIDKKPRLSTGQSF